jgi:hypothetical protein
MNFTIQRTPDEREAPKAEEDSKLREKIMKINAMVKKAVNSSETANSVNNNNNNNGSSSDSDSSSESEDSMDSDAARIIKIIAASGGDFGKIKEDRTEEDGDNVDGGAKKKKAKDESRDEEVDSRQASTTPPSKKKRKEGATVYEDAAVDPSTRRGEEELEQLFEANSVRNFPKWVAEDAAKIIEEKYGLKSTEEKKKTAPKKKMPPKKSGGGKSKKKTHPKKQKKSGKSAGAVKLSPSLMKKLKALSRKK